MVSSDSPESVEEDDSFSSFCSSRILMAPERSSANCATRWIAAHEVLGADDHELVVVAGQDGLVVGELAGELAASQDASADAEEERLVVVREVDGLGIGVLLSRPESNSAERLA